MNIQEYIETELRRLEEEMYQAERDENWQLCERAIGARFALVNLEDCNGTRNHFDGAERDYRYRIQSISNSKKPSARTLN